MSKKEIKLLHIASFIGNIGDNASHNGLYSLLEKYCNISLNITQLEIRKAYQIYNDHDKWSWNNELIKIVNQQDLTIIGGGNYFAPWIENSASGTTIDLPLQLIDKIKKPFIFYGVGFDPYTNGYTENTLSKFSQFIQKLTSNPNILIAVRNDGSVEHLHTLTNKNIYSKIEEVPDSGFFLSLDYNPYQSLTKEKYIAINLAKDMLDKRFQKEFSYDKYLHELQEWVLWIKEKYPKYKLVFIPHIYSDIEAINDFLKLLPDMYIRENIIIAPHIQGKDSETLFSIYKNSLLSIGNRFHTNVCSIGLNTPSIALVTYNKLEDLYNKLNLSQRVIIANQKPFAKELIDLTQTTLSNRKTIKKEYNKIIENLLLQEKSFLKKIQSSLDE